MARRCDLPRAKLGDGKFSHPNAEKYREYETLKTEEEKQAFLGKIADNAVSHATAQNLSVFNNDKEQLRQVLLEQLTRVYEGEE